jgi:hypothetical protein
MKVALGPRLFQTVDKLTSHLIKLSNREIYFIAEFLLMAGRRENLPGPECATAFSLVKNLLHPPKKQTF